MDAHSFVRGSCIYGKSNGSAKRVPDDFDFICWYANRDHTYDLFAQPDVIWKQTHLKAPRSDGPMDVPIQKPWQSPMIQLNFTFMEI